jgi:16S rRNA (guanine(1405)-N(7))-methyltransferase
VTSEQRVVAALLRTRKYADLAPELLSWAARDALARGSSERSAVDLARRKLHQVCGAFVDAAARKRVLRALGAASEASSDDAWREALDDALRAHASTAERAADHGALWRAILERTGPVHSVLDLGCGLHPLTLPWSGLDPEVVVEGWDLDAVLCRAVQESLSSRWTHVSVHAGDVRGRTDWAVVDLALLLKLAPTLEHEQAGATVDLVRRLRARRLVLSWPTRTLGGHRRAPDAEVERTARSVVAAAGRSGDYLRIGTELVAVVEGGS